MAFLPRKEDLREKLTAATSTAPIVLDTGGSGGDSGGEGGMAPSASVPGSTPFSAMEKTSSPFGPGLTLEGASDRVGRISGDISNLAADFYSGAGESRTFGGDMEGTLRGGISGEGSFDDALALMSAEYTGPGGLDPETLADYERDLNEAKAIASGLAGGRGLVNWERNRTGGTPGEALFDARRRAPEIMTGAMGLGRDIQAGLVTTVNNGMGHRIAWE